MNSEADYLKYRPIVDSGDRVLETELEYAARMSPLLPQFPADVLGQWFYDHWMQIGENSWLDIPSLRFQLQIWSSDSIPQSDFGHEELLVSRVQYFRESRELPERFDRLLKYMKGNGTWPRPILVLDTKTPLVGRPPWLGESRYHLIEGHNRVAGFRYIYESGQLQENHHIWLITRQPAI